MIEIRALHSGDAGQIWQLSQQAYPGSFSLSEQDLEETLDDLTPEENFCFGVFDEDRLIAYLMCWLDTSQIEERLDEPVLLLDDIVVHGASRRYLIRLLRRLRQSIEERNLHHLAIEGTHRQQAEELFNRHPQVVRGLGYQLAAIHHYFGEREQERLCWARYEPVQDE